MDDPRDLKCRCGATRWRIAGDASGTHVECYCADCQTFARHLGADADYLDAAGGTEVFQTLPHHVRFTQGAANLRLLRLSPKGLLRWYAGCCGTPIGNTMSSPSIPFVGMILRPGQSGFGPVLTHANTASARTPVRATGIARAMLGLLARTAAAKLTGKGGTAPFFTADGTPAAEARILTLAEREAARPPGAG